MTLDEKLLLLVGRHAVGEDNIALGAAGVSIPAAARQAVRMIFTIFMPVVPFTVFGCMSR